MDSVPRGPHGPDDEQPATPQPVVRSGPRLEAALAYLLALGRKAEREAAERAEREVER